MPPQPNRYSIFSQSLDRSTFTAYFLGAVVPLGVLAWMSERYVVPTIPDFETAIAAACLAASLVGLTLGSFLVLRRTTHQVIARMDDHNRRLSTLLDTAAALATSPHRSDAAAILARSATVLAGAPAALTLMRETGEGKDGRFAVLEQAGDEAPSLWLGREAVVQELSELAREQGRPGVRDGDGEGPVAVVPIGAHPMTLVVARLGSARPFDPGEVDALTTLAGLGAVSVQNSDLQETQRNFFVHVTEILVASLDVHLEYHRGHAHRVAHIANRVAREMDLTEERLERLHFAALLHDIGMLRIERDQESQKVLRTHPNLGFRMLNPIRVWEDIAPFVLHHHEWFDGRGYPSGLAGEDIPLESRIIGLAEAVDSMTSSTSYKDALSIEQATRQVEEGSGSQFDPTVARAFLDLLERGAIEIAGD